MPRSKSGEVDLVQLGAVVIAPILAAMVFGVFTLDVNVFGLGEVLMDPLWESGDLQVTIAALGATGGAIYVAFTNEFFNEQGDEYETAEYAAVGASLLAVPIVELIPVIGDFVTGNDVAALAATVAFAAAITAVSYAK